MSSSDLPTLDQAVLQELRRSTGDDDQFLADLIATYLEDGTRQLDAIEVALGSRDPAALVRPAHTLKTSSATMGALRLAEICRQFELAGRGGLLQDDRASMADAREEWSRVRAALSAPVARRAGP